MQCGKELNGSCWHCFIQKDNCVVNKGLHYPLLHTDQKKNTIKTYLLCKTSETLILVNSPLNTYTYLARIHFNENGKLVTSVFSL